MKRPRQHIMETESDRLLEQFLPSEWITRQILKDYGVDYEIEIVDHNIVSGKRIWVQLKSVEKCKHQSHRHELFKIEEEYVPYSVSTNLLEYSLRCPFPLLLFVADLSQQEIYWLPLQYEISFSLAKRNSEWLSQKSATVRIPIKNRLSIERQNNYRGLRWYALEPSRIYALMQLHRRCDEFVRSNRISFHFADGWIDSFEELELRKSIQNLKLFIEQIAQIEVLFGNQADTFCQLMASWIEVSLESADKALALLDSKEFTFSELGLLLGKTFAVLEALERDIVWYFDFNQGFLVTGDL